MTVQKSYNVFRNFSKHEKESDFIKMIKKMELSQLDEVMEIWLKTNQMAHDFIPNEYWSKNYEMVKEMLPKAEIYVYEIDRECAGFIGIMDTYIAGIFIKQKYQSRGYGKSLLDHVKNEYSTLSLHVYKQNLRAMKFYGKEGFEKRKEQIEQTTGEIEIEMQWKR